jgi:hypothetical protein
MPKRLRGYCPDCGRSIAKRGGKLRSHTAEPFNARPARAGEPRAELELCPGGGKPVPSIQYR